MLHFCIYLFDLHRPVASKRLLWRVGKRQEKNGKESRNWTKHFYSITFMFGYEKWLSFGCSKQNSSFRSALFQWLQCCSFFFFFFFFFLMLQLTCRYAIVWIVLRHDWCRHWCLLHLRVSWRFVIAIYCMVVVLRYDWCGHWCLLHLRVSWRFVIAIYCMVVVLRYDWCGHWCLLHLRVSWRFVIAIYCMVVVLRYHWCGHWFLLHSRVLKLTFSDCYLLCTCLYWPVAHRTFL